MAAIETLFKITASVAGANAVTALGQEIAKVSTQGENLQRSFEKVGTALKLFAIGEGASMFSNWVKSSIDLGVQLDRISQKTGVSVETLGHLKGAADEAGVNLDDLSSGLVKFDRSITAAQDGTSKQAAAFDFLGISTTDANGHLKTTEQLMGEVSDVFADAPDGIGKTTLATDLFGKAGANLIPMLNMGNEAMQELGLTIGPEFTEMAHQNEVAMNKIKTQWEQLGITITSEILPGLTAVEEGFAKSNLAAQVLTVTVKGVETAFIGLEAIGSLVTTSLGALFAQLTVRLETLGSVAKDVASFNYTKARGDIRDGREMLDDIEKEKNEKEKKDHDDYAAQIAQVWDIGGVNEIQATAKAKVKKPTKKKGTDLDGYAPGNAVKAATQSESAWKSAQKWLLTQDEVNQSLAEEADYLGKTSIEIDILKANRKLDAEAAVKSIGLTADQKAAFMDEEAAVKASRDAILQHNYELSRMAETGAVEYLKKYAETASDSASQVKTVMGDAFKGLEDVFVNFTQTGKLSFSNLITSMLADLARLSVQRNITGPLATALGGAFSGGMGNIFGGGSAVDASNAAESAYFSGGSSAGSGGFFSSIAAAFADGGVMTSRGSIPLKKYAGGGVANSPQLAMFGEGRTPEAYVPLPDGRSIPVTMKGGGDANNINIVVNMPSGGTGGNSTDSTQGGDAKGQALGRMIASAVKSTIIDEKRPGGLLATK